MQEVAKLGPSMYMGQAALQGLEPSKTNVVAVTNVDLLQLQRSDAVRLLGAAFLQLVAQSTVATAKKVKLQGPAIDGVLGWVGEKTALQREVPGGLSCTGGRGSLVFITSLSV